VRFRDSPFSAINSRFRYKKYVRRRGADISIREFVQLYWNRAQGAKLKIPKAVARCSPSLNAEPANAEEREIARMIAEFNAQEVTRLEQEMFTQRKRLARSHDRDGVFREREPAHDGKSRACAGRQRAERESGIPATA
jgi:hypothetical protein